MVLDKKKTREAPKENGTIATGYTNTRRGNKVRRRKLSSMINALTGLLHWINGAKQSTDEPDRCPLCDGRMIEVNVRHRRVCLNPGCAYNIQ